MLDLFLRKLRLRRRVIDENPRQSVQVLLTWVGAMVVLHILAMMLLEELRFVEAVWLTATTIVTVGYGDLSAKTDAGRLATILLMYAGGIFVLAKAVADWAEWRGIVREKKATGTWDWKMNDHLLLVGEPSGDIEQHVGRLVDQVRADPDWSDVPVILLTAAFDGDRLPGALAGRGIVHVAGRVWDRDAVQRANPSGARAVLVFAPSETDRGALGPVLDAVMRLREASATVHIVAECPDEGDRQRLLASGATQAIRTVHGYPEMAVRALVSPGAEMLIENLFTAEGDECRRYNLPRPWSGPWAEVVQRIVGAGIGTPLGYVAGTGQAKCNPVGSTITDATALFVIVHDRCQTTAKADIERALFGS